jgi:hypothetical protein
MTVMKMTMKMKMTKTMKIQTEVDATIPTSVTKLMETLVLLTILMTGPNPVDCKSVKYQKPESWAALFFIQVARSFQSPICTLWTPEQRYDRSSS